MSWRQYSGHSVGRILHFLHVYCGLDVAEQAVVARHTINYRGRDIADYVYSNKFGEEDVPIFTFYCQDYHIDWNKGQESKREYAIKSAMDVPLSEDERSYLNNDAVKVFKILNTPAFRSASVFFQGKNKNNTEKQNLHLELFLAKRFDKEVLMFESYNLYYWNQDLNCWLRAS